MAKNSVLSLLFMFMFMFICSNGTKDPSPPLAQDNNSNSNVCKEAVGSTRQLCIACGMTTYKDLCQEKLINYPGAKAAKPPELAVLGLRLALKAVEETYEAASKLLKDGSSSSSLGAIRDCVQLMADSRDQLSLSIATLSPLVSSYPSKRKGGESDLKGEIKNALVWTSAALSYHSTCTDGLKESNQKGPTALAVAGHVDKISSPLVTNALDLLAHLGTHLCTWQEQTRGHYPAC